MAHVAVWANVLQQCIIIGNTLNAEAGHKYQRLSIGFGLRASVASLQSSNSIWAWLRTKRNQAQLLKFWKEGRTQHQIDCNTRRQALAALPTTDESELALQLVIDSAIREISAPAGNGSMLTGQIATYDESGGRAARQGPPSQIKSSQLAV